jgi:polyisoprenoid-binding protein YceI
VQLPFSVAGAVKDPRGNTRFGVAAQTKINRRDFGINFGGPMTGGGLSIGDEVNITLNLEVVQPAPKPAGL